MVLLYAAFGGMLAGVYTDVVQGVLMLAAAVGIFAHAIGVSGGWARIAETISASSSFGPQFLEPTGHASLAAAVGLFFLFGVGVLGQPQMLHKFYMLDDPRALRWLPAILGGSQIVCLLIWVGLGLALPALVAQSRLAPLTRPDEAAAIFLIRFTPDWLAGLVLAGVLAAIMSTADSFVNIGSAALVRDLPRALGRPVKRELAWSRVVVVLLGVGASAVALSYGDLVALLGTFAFGTFAAALAPSMALGLNWPGVTPRAATASIAVGLLGTLGLELSVKLAGVRPLPLAAGVPPAAWSLALSFVTLIVVARLDRRWAGRATAFTASGSQAPRR